MRRWTKGLILRSLFIGIVFTVLINTLIVWFKPSDFDDKITLFYDSINNTRLGNVFLVVGVPTKKRPRATYLTKTLRELLEGLEDEEKEEVLIIVYITDFDPSAVQSVQKELLNVFPEEIKSGLIHVVKAPQSYYPSLDHLPRLWGDTPERIRWRSKQCLDYAYLFNYSKDLGQYYIQLEDDVLVEKEYLKKIKGFINDNQNRSWSMLEFGARGFIGMMYRASDLGRLATFVKMFHWVFPVDILNRQFNDVHLYGNPDWLKYKPPLFLHVGTFSSLDGQVRKLEDIKTDIRVYKNSDNPKAKVSTSIVNSHLRNNISVVYDTVHHGMFWGKDIKKGDFILVHFIYPVRVSKLIVESGGDAAPDDYFGGAKIFYSKGSGKGQCKDFVLWREYKDEGQLKVQSNKKKGLLCQCLKIKITEIRKDKRQRPRWLAIREIAVWTSKKEDKKISERR